MGKSRPVRRNKAKRQPWIALAVGVGVLAVVLVALQLAAGANASATVLPREVTVAQAAAMRDSGAFVLDVRQPEEWEEYHIPDATFIPLGELATRLAEVPRDQDVVVVCRSGNRSAVGRDLLVEANFTRVTSMAGGVSQWRADGYPVVSGP
jgi:rhodanese-related sulfurtransferase